jgi:hypothetical protein
MHEQRALPKRNLHTKDKLLLARRMHRSDLPRPRVSQLLQPYAYPPHKCFEVVLTDASQESLGRPADLAVRRHGLVLQQRRRSARRTALR